MRRCFLVTYDISDARRLRQVFKVMNDYGDHLQFSVFLCQLNPVECLRMEARLKKAMNEKDDQVLLVDLGPSRRDTEMSDFVAWGRPLTCQSRAKIA